MVILTGEVYPNGDKDVLCTGCSCAVGRMGGDEIAALSLSEMDGIYCFECDSFGADVVHPALLNELRVYDLVGREGVWGDKWSDLFVIFDGGHTCCKLVRSVLV